LECGSLLPLSWGRACSRRLGELPNGGQQAGLKKSGSKLPHSKAGLLAGKRPQARR
jgi:hypothetical protein